MKTRKIIIIPVLFSVMICAALAFSGCRGNNAHESGEEIEIVAKNPMPSPEPYKDFDIYDAFFSQEGVEYSFEGYYVNDKDIVKDLVFDGSRFRISADNAVFVNVTVTGKKGDKTASREFSFDIKGEPDAVDYGYVDLWKEPTISKTVNYNPKYIKDGNSSVKVSFAGFMNSYGTQFANLMGHLCSVEGGIYDTEYFSVYKEADQEKAWEDAVMTFWVYYSNTPKDHEDAPLKIGYRFTHITSASLPAGAKRDFDFGEMPLTECVPGEWTQVAIRFKDLNKTTPLELNFDRYKKGWTSNDEVYEICDCVNLKCVVSHEDYESMEIKYTYSFYLDGVDIMTYDKFSETYPDYVFDSSEEAEGYDYGDTIVDKIRVENWKNGGKGISFVYSFVEPDAEHENDLIGFYEWKGEGYEWKRLTQLIEIDFEKKTASFGKIKDLGGGRYRYELMFEDAPINDDEGEQAYGNETANIIWFADYSTKLNTNGFKVINSYSE